MVRCVLVLLCVATVGAWSATDSIRVSFTEIATAVRANNAQLRSDRLDASAIEEMARQSGLADNPQFDAEIPLYTGSLNRWLDAGRNGQLALSVRQALPVTGSRSFQQQAGMLASKSAYKTTEQLERNMLLEAYSAFNTLAYSSKSRQALSRELELIESLIQGLEVQAQKGNVPMHDVIRIKAVAYAIREQRRNLRSVMIEANATLQLLTGIRQNIIPVFTPIDTMRIGRLLSSNIDSLISVAIGRRDDVSAAQLRVRSAETAGTAAERKAIPEPSLGLMYDRAGSYATDYYALTFTVPLPAFDRNQHAKQAAYTATEREKTQLEQTIQRAELEIRSSLEALKDITADQMAVDADFVENAESLTNSIVENYRHGNISLLEFVDFIETYNDNVVRLNAMTIAQAVALARTTVALGENINE